MYTENNWESNKKIKAYDNMSVKEFLLSVSYLSSSLVANCYLCRRQLNFCRIFANNSVQLSSLYLIASQFTLKRIN